MGHTASALTAAPSPSYAAATSSIGILANASFPTDLGFDMATDTSTTTTTTTTSTITVDATGFQPPQNGGGSIITKWPNPDSLGEPLNMIISGESDPEVLVDSKLKGGIRNYFLSGYEGDEAFGIHRGDPQLANLGDGQGWVPQIRELRHNYKDLIFGTLTETLIGGNHLRYWHQNSSGAYFVQLGAEKSVKEHHDIVPDGYDEGRDQFVSKLVGTTVKKPIAPGTVVKGESSSFGWRYESTVKYVPGLMDVAPDKINHYQTVGINGTVTDGLVAVVTVKITKRGLL